MEIKKETIHRLAIVNDCGCQSKREFKDAAHKEALNPHVFTPCDAHKKASKDVRDILEMMTNQLLTREAEATVVRPQISRDGTSGSAADSGVVITEGGSSVASGAEKTQTISMKMPKRTSTFVMNEGSGAKVAGVKRSSGVVASHNHQSSTAMDGELSEIDEEMLLGDDG